MILFSIVIPTYNRAHVLCRAIDSIIAQTYSHWELLIVDDGSEDTTEEIVARYLKYDPRIRYIKRPDDRLRGGNACRNIGAENAKGDYITYLDSDDYYFENRLLSCANFISQTSAVCMVSGRCLDDNGTIKVGKSRPFFHNETEFDYLLSKQTLTATSSYVVKNKVLDEVIWKENLLRNQDWDFFIEIGKKFKWEYLDNFDVVIVRRTGERKFMDIPSCLKVYNDHKSQISNINNANIYLRVMMEYSSKYFENIRFAPCYFELLKANGYKVTPRDNFQINFPYLFYFLYRVKKFFNNTK